MTTTVVTDEQLGTLARRQNDLFRRVREGTLPIELVLVGLQNLIEGDFGAIPQSAERRLIDCDAAPFVPNDWSVVEHKKGGQLAFDASKIVFHLDPAQKKGRIVGNDLWKKLANKPVLNACVLDHLLANTNLIPEDWKFDEQGRTRYIFFWGTIYRGSVGGLYVRCLSWLDGQWSWHCRWLDDAFGGQRPAAFSAS